MRTSMCVYVNKMDKNLSSVNPHEFIAFCNFPKARQKNRMKILFVATATAAAPVFVPLCLLQRYKAIEQLIHTHTKKRKSHDTKLFSYTRLNFMFFFFSLSSSSSSFFSLTCSSLQHFYTLMLADEIHFTLQHFLLFSPFARHITLLLLLCGVVTATCFDPLQKWISLSIFFFLLSFVAPIM